MLVNARILQSLLLVATVMQFVSLRPLNQWVVSNIPIGTTTLAREILGSPCLSAGRNLKPLQTIKECCKKQSCSFVRFREGGSALK
jgi:hypothetical protein